MPTAVLLSVAAPWALAVVSPGPNFVVTARLALARSRRASVQAVCGIGAGTVCWAAAGCLGVRALFLAAPWSYDIIKAVGAAYLVFLGGKLMWNSWFFTGEERGSLASPPLHLSPFQIGLLTAITNPRSSVSVASIFATAMPDDPPLGLVCGIMALMVAIAIGWYGSVAILFAEPRLARAYYRRRLWLDRASGWCLVYFGVRIAIG